MIHNNISRLLASLFALIPFEVFAQQLKSYEYWFDDDIGSIVSKSISGTEATINIGIPTQQLSIGLHRLNFRAKQSDNMYSSVTSSLFFNHNVSEGNKIEYWFDDMFENRVIVALPTTTVDDFAEINLNMQDETKFPLGLHRLNFRVSTEGKSLSSIYSANVLKIVSGDADIIEYWVDGDIANRKRVNGHPATSGDHDYVFVDPFDLSGVSTGLHQIFFRATSSNGHTNTAVNMATVVVHNGATTQLEYWIDDDRSNIHTFSGIESADHDGYIFISDLDLGNISPGHHRISFRAKSNSGKTVSAITTAHIMVNSKYNDPTNLTVTEYSIAVDNGELMKFPVKGEKSIVNIPHTLDVRGLQEGDNHRVDMTIYNSVGASVSTWDTFAVNPSNDPVITLNANEEKGNILLQFNSIPNEVKYKVYRKDQNGVEVILPTFHNQNYPNTNEFLDAPLAGKYSYEIEGTWSDFYGKENTVRSNNVTITTEGSILSSQFGIIEGMVRLDGKQMAQLPNDLVMDVNFSDGAKVRVQENGSFYRNDVPLGMPITMTLSDLETSVRYSFDIQTATLTEEKPVAQVVFNGVSDTDSEMIENLGYSELVISSSLKCTDTSFSFEVKNISGRTWTGNVSLRAVRYSDLAKYDSETGFSSGSSFSFQNYDSYFVLGSQNIRQLANGKTENLTIDFNFDNIPISDKDEDYCIYMVSSEEGRSRIQLLNTIVDDVSNPKKWTLQPTIYSYNYSGFVQTEANAYLKEIFDIMDIFKKIDGPFKIVLNQAADQLDLYDQENYYGDGIFGNLPELLRSFGDDFVNAVKDVDDVVQILEDFKSFCNKANEIYGLMNLPNEDSFTIWNKAMKATFEAYEACGGPYASLIIGMYKLYLDATVKAVEHIERYGKELYRFREGEFFYDGVTKFRIKVRKYSPFFENSQFKAENIAKMIKDVTIVCKAPNDMIRHYHAVPNPSGRVLELEGEGGWVEHNMYDQNPTKEFYMEIIWKNDRLTKIPLGEGIVDIDGDYNDAVITVSLQSGSNNWFDMDNKIKIIYTKKDLNKE